MVENLSAFVFAIKFSKEATCGLDLLITHEKIPGQRWQPCPWAQKETFTPLDEYHHGIIHFLEN